MSRSLRNDNKAQLNTPMVSGVVMLGIAGIIFALMIMIYANVQPELQENSCKPIVGESWTAPANNSSLAVTYTMCATPAFTISGSAVVATDYTVHSANSSIVNLYTDGLIEGTVYSVSYLSEGTGYTSANKISTNMYKGFDLGSIAPLIMGASLVITIVLGMVGAFAYSRRD